MNWFQTEHDIRAKFDESEAGARRSNELRQLDDLRAARNAHRNGVAAQFRARLTATLSTLFRRQTAPGMARGGSTQPRVARVFRKK